MKTMSNELKELFKAMNARPVAYYPVYVSLTGSVTAGILLSQLIYWAQAVGWREFHKKNEELMDETGLSKDELKLAKKRISTLVKISLKGKNKVSHYEIDYDNILAKVSGGRETRPPDGGKPAHRTVGNPPTLYTETTAETTSDIFPGGAVGPKPEEPPEPEDTIGRQVNRMIKLFAKVNPTGYKTFFKIKKQRSAIENLLATIGEEELARRIEQLEEHNKTPRAWIMTTPVQLEAGLSNMIAFWEQKEVAKSTPTGQQRGVLRDGTEVVKIGGEWKDAASPFRVTLNTSYYPEIAKGEVISKRDWDAGKRYQTLNV